ncbi:hypothetical protein Golob_018041, partial [Gossypium lobatum]|nr:hypothetical protein [Gossypium lobatum]
MDWEIEQPRSFKDMEEDPPNGNIDPMERGIEQTRSFKDMLLGMGRELQQNCGKMQGDENFKLLDGDAQMSV